MMVQRWEAIASAKQAQRYAAVPQEWILPENVIESHLERPISIFEYPIHESVCPGIMSPREVALTSTTSKGYDATHLTQLLAKGGLTSSEVTLAFCKRAAICHQLTNCFTEIMFSQALARAKELDKIRETAEAGSFSLGALHGLPVTVKDSFHVRGFDTSIGITSLCNKPATSQSPMVQILLDSSAVIIAKTTVPQTLLTADTDSIVFGRTVNAYRTGFGAGGSSGGEGVAVAMGASSLGIGTDGAGSVRIPAFVNGVLGLRPSGYRWPASGVHITGDGICGTTLLGPVPVAGPICRSVRDVRLILKVLSEAEPWKVDPFLLPSPWLELNLSASRPLRIGVWQDHDHVHLLPPVSRALDLARSRLEAATGPVEFVTREFKGPSINRVWNLQKQWVQIQDIRPLREMLATEPVTPIVAATKILHPDEPLGNNLSLDYLHAMNFEIASLVLQMAAAWDGDSEPLDALLWVPAPHPALPFDQYTDLTFTGLFNVIDWPAMVLPMKEKVNSTLGDLDASKRVRPADLHGEEDRRIQDLYYDQAERFEGLPLSVQLIGRRGEDERLVAIAEAVGQAIHCT